jgi:hypothetical protein
LIAKSPEVQALVDAAKLVFKHNDTYFYGSSGIEKQRLNFNKVGKELRAALAPFTGKESK